MQLKEDAKLIQQKGRPLPIHSQQSVEKEIEKLTKQGQIEKAYNIDENCFVSPAVIRVKKDKSVKNALDSRKLNEITVKRKAQITTREKQPDSTGPISQSHGEKQHVWPRQTTEVNERPAELKSPPRLAGRSKQPRPTYNNNRQHDRHGDPPCY